MDADEDPLQFRHASLPTRQCRLRHLRGIAVRNLTLKGKRPLPGPLTQIQVFFTLHLSLQHPAFYTSSKITGSLNPTWTSVALAAVSEEHNVDLACKFVIVRVWQGWQDKCHLGIEWQVDLRQLIYLGEKIQQEGCHFTDDSLVFTMFEGYYGLRPLEVGGGKDCEVPVSVAVSQTLIRNSYNVHTLLRIQMILRAIKQTRHSVEKVRQHIEEKLPVSSPLQNKISQRELLTTRTRLMCNDFEWRVTKLHSAREKSNLLHRTNQQRECAVMRHFEVLQQDKTALHENKKSYFEVREELIKTGAQLVMRRKQLISELSLIYPIVEESQGRHTICGVRLPNSEDFAGQDETMISVALGYTSHLVAMIAQFLDVPLRYPVMCQGSGSQISDYIIDKLTEKERDFPLYSKGRERLQFNYAVYLLNKDIAQLRFYCGLGTTDLRLTLSNLITLLELRLGAKMRQLRSFEGDRGSPTAGRDVVGTTHSVSQNVDTNPVSLRCTLGKFVQFVLLQFTELCEFLAIDRGVTLAGLEGH